MDELQYWRRIAALAHELETLLDRDGDADLDSYLLDTDTAVAQVWHGLPFLKTYAQERLDQLAQLAGEGVTAAPH